MTTPNLGPDGLTVDRTAEVREKIVAALEASSQFGPKTQTGADKKLGQLIDPFADQVGLVYELLQAVYDSWDPDAAEGVQLDNLCRLVGVTRQPATASVVTLTLGGSPFTPVPGGSEARVPGGVTFALDTGVLIGAGGSVDAAATATETGALEAAADSVTEVVSVVSGWDTVTNAADATIGDEVETDSALRARREQSLSAAGTATDQAIRAALEDLADVTAARVISNRTLVTDSNGTPGKAFLTVLWPASGLDIEAIAIVLWENLPSGIYSHGVDVIANVTDSQGQTQTVRASYATPRDVYWEVDVTAGAGYPEDGDDLVADAVLAYGQTLSVGDDVLPKGATLAVCDTTQNPTYVPGVDHLVVKVGFATSPTGTVPLDVADTEISQHALGRIVVNS